MDILKTKKIIKNKVKSIDYNGKTTMQVTIFLNFYFCGFVFWNRGSFS